MVPVLVLTTSVPIVEVLLPSSLLLLVVSVLFVATVPVLITESW